jgi:hypothetical protein
MRFVLAGTLLLIALSATPAGAATAFNVGTGSSPDVVTDESGNAHVVWQDGNTVRYCRVPKGATACNATSALTAPGNADSGDQTAIVNPGNTIVYIVTHRSSSTVPSDTGTYLFTSGNNGNSFNAPVKVGTSELRGGAIAGPGTGVSVVTEQSNAPQYQRLPFPAVSPNNSVATLPNSGTLSDLPTVGIPLSGRPLVAWVQGVNNDIAYDQYKASSPAVTGNGPPPPANVSSNWGPTAAIAAQGRFPKIASGPNGLVLQFRNESDKTLRAIRLNPANDGFAPPEGAQTVSPAGSISEDDLSANRTSGHFASVWTFTGASGTELRYARSDAGTAWTAPVPILRGFTSANTFHVSTAPDDSGWVSFRDGSNVSVAPLEAIVDPPPGGGSPNPNPGSGNPNPNPGSGNPNPGTGTAPSNPLPGGQITVGNEVIQLFGPTSCVTPGQKVKLRVTSKRKKKLAGNKGRSKITQATFYVDKTKKKDKKKAFQQTFKTDGFAPASNHKLGANLKLKQLSGKKKKYGKKLKGSLTMCS